MANDTQQDARDAFDASRRRRREAATIDATATDVTPPAAQAAADATRAAPDRAETSPEPPRAAAPPPQSESRGLGAIPAALIGGAAGAAIASLIFLASAPRDATAELSSRIAALDARLKGVATPEALAALDKRVAAAETAAKTAEGVGRSAEGLAKAAGGAVDAARAEGKQETARLAAAIAALPKPTAPAASIDLAPLDQRLARVEQSVAQAAQSIPPLAAQAAAAATKPVADRLAVVEQRPVIALKPIEDRVTVVEQALRGSLDDLSRRLAAIEPRVAPPVDLKPLSDRLAALDQRLGPVEQRLTEQKSEARVAPDTAVGAPGAKANSIAIAAQATAQALDRGAPYQTELAALESLGVEPLKIAPLKRFATSGAPTARALADAFTPLANTVAANAGPNEAQHGVAERLKSAASRLVQIRRVGEAGDDAPALASRIETALSRGALADALSAWTKLPGPAKAASQQFGSDLAGRVAADDAARAILGEAFAALGRSKS